MDPDIFQHNFIVREKAYVCRTVKDKTGVLTFLLGAEWLKYLLRNCSWEFPSGAKFGLHE